MNPCRHVQLLTRNLRFEIVDTLGTFGTCKIDGRVQLHTAIAIGREILERENHLRPHVGFEVRYGTFDTYRVLHREIV